MSQETVPEPEVGSEEGDTGDSSLKITAAVGVLALLVVVAAAVRTAPPGAGIWHWFGVLFGAVIVGGIAAAAARRVQRRLE